MQNVRAKNPVLLSLGCAAILLSGCRGSEPVCPTPAVTVDPETIPSGDNDTAVFVTVHNPNPENGRDVLTELYAKSGTFDDPHALNTAYACAHDVSGEVEICVDAVYGPPIDAGSASGAIGAAVEYLRAPHAYFIRPEDCLETACTTVVCPGEKNECPVIDELSVEPEVVVEGQTATVRVVANDPDDNPAPLVTTLVAAAGTFNDRYAAEAIYTCDPDIGGPIEICVDASDGDQSCDVFRCVTVECYGPVPDNVCPVIRNLTADPERIERGKTDSLIRVDAFDPDAVNPDPLVTTLSASAGTFDDKNADATLFHCGAPGDAEICVKARDGDTSCKKERCITVQCPGNIDLNECPKLYVFNAIPSDLTIEGKTETDIQVRASDGDNKPLPLTTTLEALSGTFDDIHGSDTIDTIYHCERSGLNELCVDASDGACVRTDCTDVICP